MARSARRWRAAEPNPCGSANRATRRHRRGRFARRRARRRTDRCGRRASNRHCRTRRRAIGREAVRDTGQGAVRRPRCMRVSRLTIHVDGHLVLSRITPSPAVTSRRGRRTRSGAATLSTAAPARRGRAARGGRKQPAKWQCHWARLALEALGNGLRGADPGAPFDPIRPASTIQSPRHGTTAPPARGPAGTARRALVDGAAGIGRNGG
jgi:hypothetical protein